MSKIANLSGANGIYNGQINNPSVRYGRNAISNLKKHNEEVRIRPDIKFPDIKNIASASGKEFNKKMKAMRKALDQYEKFLAMPVDYKLRYQPSTGSIDKLALMGAAYEEMDKHVSASVKETTQIIKDLTGHDNISAKAIDINDDGRIDVSEYATTILAADMLSIDPNQFKSENITGTITTQGKTALHSYLAAKNYEVAKSEFTDIHSAFNLAAAQDEFLKEKNNLV